MRAALIALLLAQPMPPLRVLDEGVVKGMASQVNCTGTGVTCTVNPTGVIWTLDVTGGGGGAPTTVPYWTGAADATLSAEHNLGALGTGLVLNTGGTPSIYAGSTCGAGTYASATSAAGALTCGTPTAAPGGSTTQVQFNDGGALAGDAGLTYDKTTDKLTLGTASGSDAISLTDGARFRLGSADSRAYLAVLPAATYKISTPQWLQAFTFESTATAGDYSLYANAGTTVAWSNGANIGSSNTDHVLRITAASGGVKINNFLVIDQNPGFSGAPNLGLMLNNDFVQIQFGAGANAHFYGDGTNIVTPAAVNAVGGFIGNVIGSATSISASNVITVANMNSSSGTPSASTFYRGDGTWSAASGSGAPTTATYITQTADAGLSAEQALSSLASGFVKVTTGTGVLSSVASINMLSDTTADLLSQAKGGTGGGSVTCAADQRLTSNGTTWSCTNNQVVVTMVSAQWTSSSTANTIGTVGTGNTEMTSPTYAANAPWGVSCQMITTRPGTSNQPRYGISTSGSFTQIIGYTVVGLAGTAPARTETLNRLTAVAAATCATGCSAAATTGGTAAALLDNIQANGRMNAQGTVSLAMAPSAAVAHTIEIGSHCTWYRP